MCPAILLVVVTIAASYVSEAAVKGSNVAVMASLCPTLRLGDGELTFEPQIHTQAAQTDKLFKLNMSLADALWRSTFITTNAAGKAEAKTKPEQGIPAEWQANWAKWAEAAVEMSEKNKEDQVRKEFGLQEASANQLEMIRQTVAAYAQIAEDEQLQATPVAGPELQDDSKLKESVLTALYGEGKVPTGNLASSTIANAAGQGYATACNDGVGADGGKTLAHVVACVCGTVNTQSTEEPCVLDGTTSVAWAATNPPTQATWKQIRAACPAIQAKAITATRIRQAIETALATVTAIGTDAYIGNFKTACDGDSTAACIKLGANVQTGDDPAKRLPWVEQLIGVAKQLEQFAEANKQGANLQAKIAHLEALTMAVTKRAQFLTPPPTSHKSHEGPPPNRQGKDNQRTQAEEEECNKKEKEPECTANPKCKWNSEAKELNKRCSLSEKAKKEAEKEETQTGCGRHGTDKTACENDKTGDKQNCAWRKGKDNEPDQEKEM
ncbi:variant surface glycoprotein (VSG), putative [Trypanosoma equiperdum]|uniref:Variant surface glycoprotein (VSG), putative n=1 Tax=Trypanosoma equiperdum TaxID=5694 RepID=A0A1G4I3D7_TRYEQ|nr:variant surface glycoprotein (VSG), putative [Trypanosoma equiperdum]